MEAKRVCVVGAGISGVVTCKYLLHKGFHPVIFEADDSIGGVWAKNTLDLTRLQSPTSAYCFSDFPWPETVTGMPHHMEVMKYIEDYASQFDLLRYVRLREKVVGLDYVGVAEEEMVGWKQWGGIGQAFAGASGGPGVWRVTVQRAEDGSVERWIFSKFVEVYYKRIVPMKKYGMLPNDSFFQAMTTCLLAILPDKFYDKVEEGSIVLKQSKNFVFCKEGIIVDGDSMPIKADLVIFCTGFKGDQKLINIFESPLFQNLMAGCLDSTVPLYRECIHPRIPQLAVIGYSESLANLYTSEMRARWLANLLRGFRLPSIENMEKDVIEWEKFMKIYSHEYCRRSSISTIHIWYNDQLCKDIGCNPKRKKGFFANLFLPYGPLDYVGVG